MSRPLRIEYENAVYHVMNRGPGRSTIFHSKIYTKTFLKCLAEASQQFGLEILAYCLMGNHYHLLVRAPRANLSRCIRHINGVYTQRGIINCKKTDGALFRGRYKAIVVDADNYLLHISRYIHRNPMEAKKLMVGSLADYTDSSYPAYINKALAPIWLNRDFVLSTQNTKHSCQVAMYLCKQYSGATLVEFAELFNVGHYSTVSQSIRRLTERLQQDRLLSRRVSVLCQDLTPNSCHATLLKK